MGPKAGMWRPGHTLMPTAAGLEIAIEEKDGTQTVSGAVWEVRLTTQHGFKVLWALIKPRVVASSALRCWQVRGCHFFVDARGGRWPGGFQPNQKTPTI